MSGRSSDDSDSDWEDVFEDALESQTPSESTDSDDTEKLTKDFEVLQLSSQDESEKSDDRASSSDSWQKCDVVDLQDDTSFEELLKTPDSRSTPDDVSSRDEPIVVEESPEKDQSDESAKKEEKDDKASGPHQEAGTSGGSEIAKEPLTMPKLAITLPLGEDWEGIVKYLVADPDLNEKLKEIQENFSKRDDGGSSSDEEKPKMLTRGNIRKIITEIMSGQTTQNMSFTDCHRLLCRATIVTVFLQNLGGEESRCNFFEIISTMLKFMDSGTKLLWLDLHKPIHSTLCEVFIEFLCKRCEALNKLELLRQEVQKTRKESIPKASGSGSIPKETGTGSIPREIGSGSIPKETGSGSIPREIGSGSIPREIGSGSIPREIGSGSIPREIGSGSIPKETGSGSIPKASGSGSIPRETGSGSIELPRQQNVKITYRYYQPYQRPPINDPFVDMMWRAWNDRLFMWHPACLVIPMRPPRP